MSAARSDRAFAAKTVVVAAPRTRTACVAAITIACAIASAAFPVSARAEGEAQAPVTAALTAPPTALAPPTDAQQLARARAYEHGEGLPKDQLLAAALYCEVAQGGSGEAAYRLGWMYANGRGVPHDDATAAALFELAARNGDQYARTMLERIGDAPGTLPDCMLPPVPLPPDPTLADEIDYGPDPFEDLPPYKQKIADLVSRMAPRYGIEPRLALAVIAVESNFDSLARSVKDARGLMQLVPETAARFRVRNPFDMADNVRGGLSYLRWLLAYYRGDIKLAAAAYNAGEGAVDRYRGVPPYPETRDYVQRVMHLFRGDRHPYDARVVEPSSFVARATVGGM